MGSGGGTSLNHQVGKSHLFWKLTLTAFAHARLAPTVC